MRLKISFASFSLTGKCNCSVLRAFKKKSICYIYVLSSRISWYSISCVGDVGTYMFTCSLSFLILFPCNWSQFSVTAKLFLLLICIYGTYEPSIPIVSIYFWSLSLVLIGHYFICFECVLAFVSSLATSLGSDLLYCLSATVNVGYFKLSK